MDSCAKIGTLLLAVVASCNIDHSCALVYCDSGATLELATFSDADAAELTGARINICFNGACSEGVIDMLPDPGGASFDVGIGAPMDPVVSISLEHFDPSTVITVSINVKSDQLALFHNGDVYTADLVGTDGSPLAHKSWSVDYQDTEPNGDGCDPTCRVPLTMTEQ